MQQTPNFGFYKPDNTGNDFVTDDKFWKTNWDTLDAQMEDSSKNLNDRMINVMHPPSPLVAPKGDGTTDDYAAIQAVINSAIAGQIVYFPTPTSSYYCSQSLKVPTGVILMGASKDFTNIKFAAGIDGIAGASYPARTSNIGLINLNIQGQSTTSGSGINLTNVCYSLIQNCSVSGFYVGVDNTGNNDASAYNKLINVSSTHNHIGWRIWSTGYTNVNVYGWANDNQWLFGEVRVNDINVQAISGDMNKISRCSLESPNVNIAEIGQGDTTPNLPINEKYCWNFTIEDCWFETPSNPNAVSVLVKNNAYYTIIRNNRITAETDSTYARDFNPLYWLSDQGYNTLVEMNQTFNPALLANNRNLIGNGGMELWNGGVLQGWNLYNSYATVSREDVNVFSGDYAVKIVSGTGSNGYQGINQTVKSISTDSFDFAQGYLISFAFYCPSTNTVPSRVDYTINGNQVSTQLGKNANNTNYNQVDQWQRYIGFYRPPTPTTWQANKAYNLNDLVFPTTKNGKVYKCTTAGTSGATQPTWSTTTNATQTDGTVTWTVCDHTLNIEFWTTYQASAATAGNTLYIDNVIVIPLKKFLHHTARALNESESTVFGNLRIDKNGNLVMYDSNGAGWKANISTSGVLTWTSFTG